jgi:hypothetical protein
MKTIYNLELNENLKLPNGVEYRRVPGGWILSEARISAKEHGNQVFAFGTFIPYSMEFYPFENTDKVANPDDLLKIEGDTEKLGEFRFDDKGDEKNNL